MAFYGGIETKRPWSRVPVAAGLASLLFIASIAVLGSVVVQEGGIEKVLAPLLKRYVAPPAKAEPSIETSGNFTEVYVPVRVIRRGETLRSALFARKPWKLEGGEELVVRSREEFEGKVAAINLMPKAPLLREALQLEGDQQESEQTTNNLMSDITVGSRAITLRIDPESSFGGYIAEGARVDVTWTTTYRDVPIVSIIVEDVLVLSPRRQDDKSDVQTLPNFVTLLMSTKDAQKVQLAKTVGRLGLTLRGTQDRERPGTEITTIDQLLRPKDLLALADSDGRVMVDGKQFEVKGFKLIPSSNDDEDGSPSKTGGAQQ